MKTEGKSTIRLVAIDLDGTLLTSEGILASEATRLLNIAGRDGMHIVLATSHVIHSVRTLCHSLETRSPVICTNGAQIYDSIDGNIWKSFSFPKEQGLAIAKLADTHGWELSTTIDDVTYYRQRPNQTTGPLSQGRAVVATNVDAVIGNPVRILSSEPDAIEKISTLCRSNFSDKCHIELYHGLDGEIRSLGVFGLRADKGNALSLVLRRLGVRQSQVMAIGDDLNDLSLFSHSRIKVAMSNAHEQLKREATAIAPSNDEEGVTWALKEFGVSS